MKTPTPSWTLSSCGLPSQSCRAVAIFLLIAGAVVQAQEASTLQERINRVGRTTSSIKPTSMVQLHAARITISNANFQEASPSQVIEFLHSKSKDWDPQKRGVNIIVPPKLAAQDMPITLGLDGVNMETALQQIATLTKTTVRFDNHAAVFTFDERPPVLLANPHALCPILRRADAMVLPEVIFANSTLPEVVEFLRFRSQAYEPGGAPMNIVLRVPPNHPIKTVTLTLRDIPMSETLRYVAELTGLALRAEAQTLMLMPPPED